MAKKGTVVADQKNGKRIKKRTALYEKIVYV
jgi:hypothetical protein